MKDNKYYKRYIEKLINMKPANITIARKIETSDGYGGVTAIEEEIYETVTFYDKKARREVVSDYGTTYTGVSVTKILAMGNADIQEGDTFKHNGKDYKVSLVKNYFDICKQIELEVF